MAPVILLYLAFAVLGFVVAVFTFINVSFWGFSGETVSMNGLFAIALPAMWILALGLGLAFAKRRDQAIRMAFTVLAILAVLLVIDGILIATLLS